jgi:hypothetical protein
MVQLRIEIEDGKPDLTVSLGAELDRALACATSLARSAGRLNIIILAAPNNDSLSLVVGSDETVLCFDYGHGNPPYYSSAGEALSEGPVFTAFVGLAHHTEFPRKAVVPMSVGTKAAFEFLATGRRPSGVRWVEV